jgi:hypothetical protein
MKRSRLKRKAVANKRDRLTKEKECVSDTFSPKSEEVTATDALNVGRDMLADSFDEFEKSAGGGSSKEFEDEHIESLVVKARNALAEHPNKDVLLKVELWTEPNAGAGLVMLAKADDVINFGKFHVQDVDSGNIYSLRRSNIRRIISVHPEEPLDLSNPHGMHIWSDKQ